MKGGENFLVVRSHSFKYSNVLQNVIAFESWLHRYAATAFCNALAHVEIWCAIGTINVCVLREAYDDVARKQGDVPA